jgi:hypothetical protein
VRDCVQYKGGAGSLGKQSQDQGGGPGHLRMETKRQERLSSTWLLHSGRALEVWRPGDVAEGTDGEESKRYHLRGQMYTDGRVSLPGFEVSGGGT